MSGSEYGLTATGTPSSRMSTRRDRPGSSPWMPMSIRSPFDSSCVAVSPGTRRSISETSTGCAFSISFVVTIVPDPGTFCSASALSPMTRTSATGLGGGGAPGGGSSARANRPVRRRHGGRASAGTSARLTAPCTRSSACIRATAPRSHRSRGTGGCSATLSTGTGNTCLLPHTADSPPTCCTGT